MREIDLHLYCKELQATPQGIYISNKTAQSVHFPEHGHDQLMAIEDNSFWFSHRNRCIITAVETFPTPGPIFDIGGGNGYVARGLQRTTTPVAMVEPGTAGCAHARARGLETVINADFCSLEFKAGPLPPIGLFDVLEHIEDDTAFLHHVREILEHGGLTYITVPAYSWLWSHVDDISGHFRRYTRGVLMRTIIQAGLTPIYCSYFFQALVPPMLVSRVLLKKRTKRPTYQLADANREHARGMLGRSVESFMKYECRSIKRKRALPFGASLLLVARKEKS